MSSFLSLLFLINYLVSNSHLEWWWVLHWFLWRYLVQWLEKISCLAHLKALFGSLSKGLGAIEDGNLNTADLSALVLKFKQYALSFYCVFLGICQFLRASISLPGCGYGWSGRDLFLCHIPTVTHRGENVYSLHLSVLSGSPIDSSTIIHNSRWKGVFNKLSTSRGRSLTPG